MSLGDGAPRWLTVTVPWRVGAQACHRKGANGGSRALLGFVLGCRLWLGGESAWREANVIPLSRCPNDQPALELGLLCTNL
eukprot:9548418-Heterocapsa_arctica.AAC.1